MQVDEQVRQSSSFTQAELKEVVIELMDEMYPEHKRHSLSVDDKQRLQTFRACSTLQEDLNILRRDIIHLIRKSTAPPALQNTLVKLNKKIQRTSLLYTWNSSEAVRMEAESQALWFASMTCMSDKQFICLKNYPEFRQHYHPQENFEVMLDKQTINALMTSRASELACLTKDERLACCLKDLATVDYKVVFHVDWNPYVPFSMKSVPESWNTYYGVDPDDLELGNFHGDERYAKNAIWLSYNVQVV